MGENGKKTMGENLRNRKLLKEKGDKMKDARDKDG